MALSGFNSDFELSLGSIVGVRAFKLDYLGRLTGIVRDSVFKPGINVAQCDYCSTKKFATCDCGFYAYFSGQDNSQMEGEPVGAVIEGTGRTIIGTKGFRTEKAELKALFPLGNTVGGGNWVARKTRWFYPTFNWFDRVYRADHETALGVGSVMAALLLLLFGFFSLFTADWELGTWMLPASLWFAGLARRFWMSGEDGVMGRLTRQTSPKRAAAPLDRLRELYPDVPVYRNMRTALRKHPLTTAEEHVPEPVLPNPTNTDDFWALPATPRRTNAYGR